MADEKRQRGHSVAPTPWLHGRGPAHQTSTSFGIGEKDFSTLVEETSKSDQSDTLYGLDIVIVFSPTKNRYSSQPKYSLSASQTPLC